MAENSTKLTQLPQEDFSAIEKAVMETERGRWFLKEYGARNRHAETEKVLEAIARIESAMSDKAAEIQQTPSPESVSAQGDKIKFDLLDMMTAIANTKREIAAIGSDSEEDNNSHINSATLELDAIVDATENATSQILESAEKIQEQAWTLREEGLADEHCDQLDTLSTDIYMACSFQDITGQRTQKVVQVLRYLENRLESMANIWAEEAVATPDPQEGDIDFKSEVDNRPDAHLLNGPQHEAQAVDQDDVDLMFVDTEDLDAAAEMEAMLDGVDEEETSDENEATTAPVADEPSSETDAENDLVEDELAEDDLIIVKQDASTETADKNRATTETDAVSPEADISVPVSELTDKDTEALFSTHQA